MKKYDSNINNVIRKRVLVCYLFICVLFTVCGIRLFTVSSNDGLKETAAVQSTVKLDLYNLRGNIYDCNLKKLTGETAVKKTVFIPSAEGMKSAKEILGETSDDYKRLKQGYAVLTDVKSVNRRGTVSVEIPLRYSKNQTAVHLIGYTDLENNGVSGIEYGMNDSLSSDKNAYISYSTDAKSRVLQGENITYFNDTQDNGVALTIDKNYQSVLEDSLRKIKCGAGVIVEVDSGRIKAMASVPTYDPNNIEKSLNDKNAPFVNRAVTPYSVGSVFKTCVSAAGIENGTVGKEYYCGGHILINKQRYNCHKLSGHGFLNLQSALAESCNCYFYQYAMDIGADDIYKTAKLCSFGSGGNLGGGIYVKGGNMPNPDILSQSDNALANFSIGQGDFMLAPVTITNLYSAVCNNGSYIKPFIIEGTVKNGKLKKKNNSNAKTKAMSENTAGKLKNMLKKCLDSGTGKSAKPEKATAGGKTATAQTGWLKNGRKIDNGWFCGFFEKNNKTYVVAVVIEDINSESTKCTEVFKNIADKIYSYY